MYPTEKLSSKEAWWIFDQIMRAVKEDGGTVSSVDALMGVANDLARHAARNREYADQERSYALGIIAAAPTPDEMDLLWERYRGPGVPRPAADPKWLKGYMPWRLEDTNADG